MHISSALGIVLLAACSLVSARKIKYKVVSYVPSNCTAGIMIDDQVYPLKVRHESPLYFIGKAPVAQTGYKYVILDQANTVIEQENFTRPPIAKGETFNEYYNRSWNSQNLSQLPTILDPLPIIHRIESDIHIEGQIPTIHLTGKQSDVDYIHNNPLSDVQVPMHMTYISLNDVKTFKNLSLAVAGHSTRNVGKLSYKINIDKHDGTLYKYRRFKLRAMAMDASYMKDELCYDIGNKIGIPTSKNSYVRLYINNQPIGLFGFAEVFKNPWIQNEFANGKHSYKQGALWITDASLGDGVVIPSNFSSQPPMGRKGSHFNMPLKGDKSDLSFLGDNATLYEAPYKLKEDPSVGPANYTRLMELTRFISQQPNDTMVDDSYAEAWEKVLDVESVLRSLAFEMVVSNIDGYFLMSNNYILYDDLQNERIVMGAQDFDLTMGVMAIDEIIGGNYSNYINFDRQPLSTTLFRVPKFKQRFEQLIYNITANLVNPDVMYPRIDSLSNLISQDVEWDKSLPRVHNMTFSVAPDFPFSTAVNGSFSEYMSHHKPKSNDDKFQDYMAGLFLKEWVQVRSKNILDFFNQNIYNNSSNTTM